MRFGSLPVFVLTPALLLSSPCLAEKTYPGAEKQVLELSKQAIALRSVEGEGNKTPEVAQLFRDALIKGGGGTRRISRSFPTRIPPTSSPPGRAAILR